MTQTFFPAFRRLVRRLAPLGLLALMSAPALAVESRAPFSTTPPPILSVGPNEQVVSRRLDLSIGRSVIVELPRDAKEVFVANPAVANAVVRSTRKLFVIGVANGGTSIFVMDTEGRQISSLEVNVGRDLNVLRQTLRTVLPKAQLEIKPAGDSVLLTGTVDSILESQRAQDVATAFVGQSGAGGAAGGGGAGGGGVTTGAVINALTIRGKDQVMLKVTIAEVQRQVLKELGVNLSAANWTLGGAAFGFTDLAGSGIGAGGARTIAGSFTDSGGATTQGVLRALERSNVMRILAEPTLVAISGENAKFLAGGEIPYPSGESFDTATGRNTITISYRPVGVTLNFTPVVLSERRISMRIATEVSELDQETAIQLNTISVPGIRTRRTETTVEVPSGGSLVSAGLIQQQSRQVIDGFPVLKNLPVLGALFRSRQYQKQETELMIAVTPYIAKPLDPGQVTRPDDGFVESSDSQAVLLGRLNKMYGVANGPASAGSYKGKFGFITE